MRVEATAMAASGTPTEVIRLWGRWLSDCWRRYVFGTAGELEDLPRTMVQAYYTLAMDLEDLSASVQRGHNPVAGPSQATDACMC